MSLIAKQVNLDFSFCHHAHQHDLNALYELTCDEVQIFRVKVRQIWSEPRFGTQVQVWSEGDLAWHDVAQVLRREPEWADPEHQWSNRGYTMPSPSELARATEDGMEAVEAEARSI